MLTASDYLLYSKRKSVQLSGKKGSIMLEGYFSPRLMTLDTRIVHTLVPAIGVMNFTVRFPSRSVTILSSQQHNKRVIRKGEKEGSRKGRGLVTGLVGRKIESSIADEKDVLFSSELSLPFHLQMSFHAVDLKCPAGTLENFPCTIQG